MEEKSSKDFSSELNYNEVFFNPCQLFAGLYISFETIFF